MEKREINYTMGNFFRDMVDRIGKPQEEIAAELEVSTRTVGYYVSGERSPSAQKLLRLIKLNGGISAEDIPSF